uniref:Sperm microtubule inner protein 1 C-terminal domain-containing protein n=1 Tax=Varanus komodoensis TaxID=61221 RepID=A0A8D2L0Z7_VARKO
FKRQLVQMSTQEGWRELIHKEASCRVSWKAKYGHRYPRRVLDHGVSRRKGFLPAIGLPAEATGSAAHQDIAVQREEERQLPEEKGALRPLEPLPEMRASTPQTLQLLYQGFSHEGRGRGHYLKERRKKSPEEKFSYPVLSSWEYGWQKLATLVCTANFDLFSSSWD